RQLKSAPATSFKRRRADKRRGVIASVLVITVSNTEITGRSDDSRHYGVRSYPVSLTVASRNRVKGWSSSIPYERRRVYACLEGHRPIANISGSLLIWR